LISLVAGVIGEGW
jgi:Ca2+ transporting ATPase